MVGWVLRVLAEAAKSELHRRPTPQRRKVALLKAKSQCMLGNGRVCC